MPSRLELMRDSLQPAMSRLRCDASVRSGRSTTASLAAMTGPGRVHPFPDREIKGQHGPWLVSSVLKLEALELMLHYSSIRYVPMQLLYLVERVGTPPELPCDHGYHPTTPTTPKNHPLPCVSKRLSAKMPR